MKNWKLLVIFIIALDIGIVVGYRFSTKLNERVDIMTAIKQNVPKPQQVRYPNKSPSFTILNFMIQEDDIETLSEADRLALENLLQDFTFQVKFVSLDKNFGETIKKIHPAKANGLVGISSPTRFAYMQVRSRDFEPVFFTSPDANLECYNEAQVIKRSKNEIITINDMSHKIVGVEDRALVQSKMFIQKLKEKNIIPQKIIVYSSRASGLKDLLNDKIDFFFTRVKHISSGAVLSGVGTMTENSFLEYPGLKVLTMTDFKIPCRLVFITKKVLPRINSDFTNKLSALVYEPEAKDLLRRTLAIGYLTKVTPEKWDKVKGLVLKGQNIGLNTLAPEVSIKDPKTSEVIQNEILRNGEIPFEK